MLSFRIFNDQSALFPIKTSHRKFDKPFSKIMTYFSTVYIDASATASGLACIPNDT